MKDQYISALKQIIATDENLNLDALLRDLKSVLEARGHLRLLPAILRGLVTQSPKAATRIELTLANKSHRETHATEIEATLAEISGGKTTTTQTVIMTEDDSLIGGYTIKAHGTLIDRSYKTTLLQLYRTITN